MMARTHNKSTSRATPTRGIKRRTKSAKSKQLELTYPQSAIPTIPETLAEAPPKSKRLAPVPCGIVLFHDIAAPGAGIAYLSIGFVQHIRCANDLRSDVLWISNLESIEEFESLLASPNLRASNYLSFTLVDIARDLGIEIGREGQMDSTDAVTLATLLTRAMTIAARAYGWDVSEQVPLRIREAALSLDVIKSLARPTPIPSEYRDELTHALTQAYQDDSAPNWLKPTNHTEPVQVTLRFNRLSYARALLACPVPKGSSWSYAKDLEMSQDLLQFCLSHASVVKASVELTNMPSDLAALVAFGQTGKRRPPMRLWLAQPELVWLSQYAQITIHAGWVNDAGYTTLGPAAQLPALFNAHPEACLSYSAGLIAANHWQALCACRRNCESQIDEANVWATWLRAYDRANMFALALKAHEAGFHVMRYGAGSLKLSVEKNQENYWALAEFKELHGLIYPDLEQTFRPGELLFARPPGLKSRG